MFNRRSFSCWAVATLCLAFMIGDSPTPAQQTSVKEERTIVIDSVSGKAELALATYLTQINV